MSLLKLLLAIWPFVKEVFFDGKSLAEIVKKHPVRVTMILLTSLSLSANVFMFNRFVDLAAGRREDSKTYQQGQEADKRPVAEGPPDPSSDAASKPIPSSLAASKPSETVTYHQTRKHLQDLYKEK